MQLKDPSLLKEQCLIDGAWVGTPKVESGKNRIEDLNPDVKVIPFQDRLTSENIDRIFDQYFGDLFGVSGLERRRLREKELRADAARRLARAIADDPVLTALAKSAAKAGRRISPILCPRRGEPRKRFRRRAVLVDGKNVELVRHVRNAQVWPGGIAYATTSIARKSLESARHVIFYIDVASHRRRVIRCRCAALLRALFPAGVKRRHIYIPLDERPEAPRYDFLADVDNWGR